jgi:hypothetical protein
VTAARAERHLAEPLASGDMPEPRVVLEDDTLPHQIRIFLVGGQSGRIAVSCTCLKKATRGPAKNHYKPIESRKRWEPGSDLAVWRAHVEAVSADEPHRP